MLLPLALLLAAPYAGTVPLAPTGTWTVDYRAGSCVLGHAFGAGKSPVTIGWRVLPLGEQAELLIGTSSTSAAMIRGAVTLRLSTGESWDGAFTSYPTITQGRRMTRIMAPKTLFAKLPSPVTLTVVPQEIPAVSVVLPNAEKAFAALEVCNRDTVKAWGIDPDTRAGVTPATAQGAAAEWITSDDFPPDAIEKGAQGAVTLLWTVGVDGRVHDCRAVVSSGVKSLDEAACRALTARGRYTPARDASGQPTATFQTRSVIWSLPGAWRAARTK